MTCDSTILRSAETVQISGMDELVILSAELVNAINEDIDLRSILTRTRHERVRKAWDALHAVMEKA